MGAVPGRYKCGIYADSGGRPDAFFGGSADIANPADGWTVFTLTSPLALAGGQYYWLAIWSNDANARVYYSDTGGTLQWGQYDYGAWPDPLVTTGGGDFDYCIYATGPVPAPVPPVIALQPESQVVNLGSNATFAVSAGGDLPLSYQWYYNATNALAGSTNNLLLVAGVGDTAAGWYSVLVSNAAGTVVSSNAQLIVNHLPVPASPTLQAVWESGGAGALRIVGSGIPYRNYTFEFEEAMGAGWQPIGAVMSDASGVFTYVESLSPGASNRFYLVTTY